MKTKRDREEERQQKVWSEDIRKNKEKNMNTKKRKAREKK